VALITLDARRVNAVKPLTDLVQLVREWIEAEVSENDEGLAEQNQQRGLFGFR
jgi:hypothetical protein